MPARPAAIACALGAALVVVACGGGKGGPTGPSAPVASSVGALAVTPPSGPIGTTFQLSATGQKPGALVSFEITFPGEGKAFPGSALTVGDDGTVAASYRATTSNTPGDYVVRLTGTTGTLAEARFTVTDGPPVTSAAPKVAGSSSSTKSTATTKKGTATTKKGVTTTTAKGGSTSTTASGASTTKAPTTTAHPTTTHPTTPTTPTTKP